MTSFACEGRREPPGRRATWRAEAQRPRRSPRRRRSDATAGRPSTGEHRAAARAVGILVFVVLVALGTGWIWALITGVAGYCACAALQRRFQRVASLPLLRRLQPRETPQYPLGFTLTGGRRAATPAEAAAAERANRVLDEARATIAGMRVTAGGLAEARMRGRVLALCDTAERIVGELQRRPGDIAQARRFLIYYLDAARHIVARYAQLGAHGESSVTLRTTLERVEPALDLLSGAFTRQLDVLLSDDALDLDAELSLLEKTVKMEGLFEAPV